VSQSNESARPRYYEVRVPVGSSNVTALLLVVCRDCGAFVFVKSDHDRHHRQITSPGATQ